MEEIREELRRITGAEDFEVGAAPKETGADFSSNVAMKMAGASGGSAFSGLSPREIAEKIAGEWGRKGFRVEVAGPGFLNFYASDEYFKAILDDFEGNLAKMGENYSSGEYLQGPVICEFSDPNPFKVLHVGHLYTSVVGDAIARMLEFTGVEVVRANFGGDVGLHVAKTLWALALSAGRSTSSADALLARRTSSTARSATPASSYSIPADNARAIEALARGYVEGTRAYEEDAGAREEIVALNKEIYRINAEDDHEGALAKAYWRGRKVSYAYFDEFYRRIGVEFDKYYPESEVAGRGVEEVLKHPKVYEESEGARVFRGEKYGLHTRVFINKEGLPTYEAKDVGLLFTKNDDYHFSKSIVITGNEITDYMKVVLKSVEQYAPELVARTEHRTHGMVKLPGAEKMSSRKGNFIRAVDVLDAVRAELPEGTDEEVAIGATKYAFLKYKVGGEIEFDAKSSVSTTGNSGVYLQYACVRAKKIIAGLSAYDGGDWRLNEHERNLIRKIGEYRYVLGEAIEELAPHKICQYLYELAQEFSRFYEKVKVVGSANEYERGRLVGVYLNVLEHGLGLLGISAPEEM